jgi:hypothetical protein
MSGGTTLPLWLRLGGPAGAVLGSGGAVAAGVRLTGVAAVLVGLAAAAVAVTLAGLLRSRS